MRGGGGLCAESEAWGTLEEQFGRIYVPHIADTEVLKVLSEMANEPPAGFLLVLVGMPGVGKTWLLKELIAGLRYEHFPAGCRSMIDSIKSNFEFRDIEDISCQNESEKEGTAFSKKRVVWVTTALDDYVEINVEAKRKLYELQKKLETGIEKDQSVMILGNRGILGDAAQADDPVILPISMAIRAKSGHFRYLRVPRENNVFWIKQFGVEESLFNLTNGVNGFRQYSSELLGLSQKCLYRCSKNSKSNPECQGCTCDVFLTYVSELQKILEDSSFVERVHNLVFFLWLKHCDLYLTPRSLNLFWAYCLNNLWDLVKRRVENSREKAVDKSLIYDAIYSSKLPSIRGPEEYSLSETSVHRHRDEGFESEVLSRCTASILDKDARRRQRLSLFFSESNADYQRMIERGALEDFLDYGRLLSKMAEILSRLVLSRPLAVKNKGLDEATSPAWDVNRLLFSPVVDLVEKPKNGGSKTKARRLPVFIFDIKLLYAGDISYHAFRIVPSDIRFLEMRERVLELDVEVRKKPLENPICFNLTLQDFVSLRDFASKIRLTDLLLISGLRRKVQAFLNNIDGMADYLISPILYEYLKERKEKKNHVGLYLLSLKDGKDCSVKIADGKMQVGVNSRNYLITLGD